MSVHFLHTSDWHLGQLFYNHPRQFEHAHFLAWLIEQIEKKQPHALLIAGDIFDVTNPSSQAQRQLYQFLADAHRACPSMQTLMIAGNHDSGYRVEQVEPLLTRYNAKAVGIVHWNADKTLNTEHLIIPIYDQQQQVVAWCVALPFLRAAEITGFNAHTSNSDSAIHYVHQYLIESALSRKSPQQSVIVMSHAHIQGAQESDSERRVIIGNQEGLSPAIFGSAVDYVALGHLHKPQHIGATHIRYCGAPIPLSFSEIGYKHQVLEVNITQGQPASIEPVIVPRVVGLHKIAGRLDEVFEQLAALPSGEELPLEQRDFIQIEYRSDTPPPLDLIQQIEQCLPVNRYRIVRINRVLSTATTRTTTSKIHLEPPTPLNLFQTLWHDADFAPDLQAEADFMRLVDAAQQQLSERATQS